VRRLVARINAVFANDVGTSFALFRIGVALSVLFLCATCLAAEASRMFWVDRAFGGVGKTNGQWLTDQLGGASWPVVRGLLAVDGVFAVCLLLGIQSRVASFVMLVLTTTVVRLGPGLNSASDGLMSAALFLLAVAPHTPDLTLRLWLRERRLLSDVAATSWGRNLALWQLVVMYVCTGLQKSVSVAWTPGGGFLALHEILQSPHYARFHELPLGWLSPLTRVSTALTWVWEMLFFLVLVKPKIRVPYAVVGVFLHIGIFALMEVGPFSIISLAFYPVLFSGAELRVAIKAFHARFRRER
jgi:hypothetical protein